LAAAAAGKLGKRSFDLDNLRVGYGIIHKLPERREVIPRFSGPASTLTIEEWNGLLREGPSKRRRDPDSILKPQPCWVEAF
jgi:hypothetical protein